MRIKKVMIVGAMISMFLVDFTVPLIAEAENTISGTGIELASGFSCSNLSIEVNANVENVSKEKFVITNEDDLAYEAEATYTENTSRNGTFSKVFNPAADNVDYTGSKYIAISYAVTQNATYYGQSAILYDCQKNSVVASCKDLAKGVCDWYSVKSYFPWFEVEDYSYETEVSIPSLLISVGTRAQRYLSYHNKGFLPLAIDRAKIEILNDVDHEFQFTNFTVEALNYVFTPKKPGHKNIIVKIPSNDPFRPVITVNMTFDIPNRELFTLEVKKINYKHEGAFATIDGVLIVSNSGARAQSHRAEVTVGLYDTENPVNEGGALDGIICSYPASSYNYTTTIAKISLPKLRKGKRIEIPFKSKKLDVVKNNLSAGDRLLIELKGAVFVKSQPDSSGILLGSSKKYNEYACDDYGHGA